MEFYLMEDKEKKKIATYLVNNGWDLHSVEAGRNFRSCKICHLDKHCTGHYGLLDIGFVMVHPLFKLPKGEKENIEDLYLINKYRGLLMKYILIPPPGIRSSDDTEWPDDLSKIYLSIIEYVKKGDKQRVITKITELFGAHKSTGIMSLLSGKNGIFRKLVFGKRIESSARSVITGDPTLDIDEVYIPKVLANNLFQKCTIPEILDREYFLDPNIKLTKEQCIPGIEAICRIKNGDLVFINRQPTLSYGSILTFRAKIRKDNVKTIGIHPNVTKTFNADFDGDEMNIFCFPPSPDLEKCHITNFPECISSIQDSKTKEYMIKKGISRPDISLDMYGLTVSLRELVNKKYKGTNMEIMIESGSKGSSKNFESIIESVGKQYLGGNYIGTCNSSYISGLNPEEFFIHSKAAREGVVSTGVYTANTGYINRKGCKVMADVVKIGNITRDNYGVIDM